MDNRISPLPTAVSVLQQKVSQNGSLKLQSLYARMLKEPTQIAGVRKGMKKMRQ
jgi:hypothetical protein